MGTKQTSKKRKQKPKQPRKQIHKPHVARTPAEVARYKTRFLARLAKGCLPGIAAERVHLCRATVYKWRKEDEEFETAWLDAVEIGLDRLETKMVEVGMNGNVAAASLVLKHRRKDVYGDNATNQTNNLNVTITLEEHTQRMVRMGLVLPVIEGDYYDEEQLAKDAPENP